MTEEKTYKRNFLTNVILRLDFSPIERLEEKGLGALSKFKEKVQKDYPVTKEVVEDYYKFYPKAPGSLDITNNQVTKSIFVTQDGHRDIGVSSRYFYLETRSYEHFKPFEQEFLRRFNQFQEEFDVPVMKRIGLRYINQIVIKRGSPYIWTGLINPSLTSVITKFVGKENKILRSLNQTEIRSDDYSLVLKFGLNNSEYPNPIARKEYTIDLDAYTIEDSNFNKLPKIIRDLNMLNYEWFEKAIGKKLRKLMDDNE